MGQRGWKTCDVARTRGWSTLDALPLARSELNWGGTLPEFAALRSGAATIEIYRRAYTPKEQELRRRTRVQVTLLAGKSWDIRRGCGQSECSTGSGTKCNPTVSKPPEKGRSFWGTGVAFGFALQGGLHGATSAHMPYPEEERKAQIEKPHLPEVKWTAKGLERRFGALAARSSRGSPLKKMGESPGRRA